MSPADCACDRAKGHARECPWWMVDQLLGDSRLYHKLETRLRRMLVDVELPEEHAWWIKGILSSIKHRREPARKEVAREGT